MNHSESRSFKVIAGMTGMFLISLLSQGYMVRSLHKMYSIDDQVMDFHANALIEAEHLRFFAEQIFANSRGFLRGDKLFFLSDISKERVQFLEILEKMKAKGFS
jgi:hypothetical protein